MNIRKCVRQRENELVRMRRDLHQIPETAFEEYQTSAYLRQQLEAMNPDSLESFCGTGLKAVFYAQDPVGTVAIRADMDALPVLENTGLPFSSARSGFMHACGHDGHMAIALTTAAIVGAARTFQKHNYVFLFQPAEETTGGAEPMIAAGALAEPAIEALYGIHLWPFLPECQFGLRNGPLMAGMQDINIEVLGRSCHGARPQDGSDAIVAAAQLVGALQTIIARNLDPEQAALLTIGRIDGGSARNILCDRVILEGTIRAYSSSVQKLIRKRINEMLSGLQLMFAVDARVSETMSYPPVVNPEPLFRHVISCLDPKDWLIPDRVMISEDFAFYQQVVPAFFAFLGTGGPHHHEPLHSTCFTFDESVLACGVEYYLRVTNFIEADD